MIAWPHAATESCALRMVCSNREECWSDPNLFCPTTPVLNSSIAPPLHLPLELRTESPEVFPCSLKMLKELRAPLSMHPPRSERPRQLGNFPGKLRRRARSNCKFTSTENFIPK